MKLITYPKYQEDRTGSLVIKEAKLSPTETKITFKSIDSSKENVRIQHTASLIAGDEKYAIQRVEGISTADFEPFSDVTNMEFSLYFEPLPLIVEEFDFKEGCNDWQILGVSLEP
ncbi:hypothetical protein [Phocaeicola abscessus]|uniref:hypothetical protein n=1 Tax=Phocaeicola abscessus TaxID=555313 RepID=UPI00055A8374|nr:hypothetical protein [Phocaeicola abscessus]